MGIERKLIVGRFIRFDIPRSIHEYIPPNRFIDLPDSRMTIEESSGVIQEQKQSNIVAGTGPKVHRNFQWLAWIPGAISAVQLARGDVLTGPMSGCWVVVFRRNGSVSVGHIGTSAHPNDPQSIAVKRAWYTFATGALQGDVIAGFNPAREWPALASLPPQQPGDGRAVTFGLVTTDRELHAVLTYKGNASANATVIPPGQRASNLYRIAEIKRVPSESPDRLRGLFPPFLPELQLPGHLQMP
jgi:hypothetical protein